MERRLQPPNSSLWRSKAFQVAEFQRTIALAQMHTIAVAVAEELAVGAIAGLHPAAVAVDLETVCPHVVEIVVVYIALIIVGSDAGARADGAVDKHRRYIYAGVALEEVVAHVALVVT